MLYQIHIDEEERKLYTNLNKLFLGGIDFNDSFGQIILNGLEFWEELTIKRCKFEVLSQLNPLRNLTSLKSLSIIESDCIFSQLNKCINLHQSLNTLKINSVKNPFIMRKIEMFKNLRHLRIAWIQFKENKIKFDIQKLPKFLKKFELIKWSVETESILDIWLHGFCLVSELVLLDNEFEDVNRYKNKIKSSNTRIKTLMFDDSIFKVLYPFHDYPWRLFGMVFPNVEKLFYYKKNIDAKLLGIKIKYYILLVLYYPRLQLQ